MLESQRSDHTQAGAGYATSAPNVDGAIQSLHGDLTRQLHELPLDPRNLSLALGSAWSILRAIGLRDFTAVRQVRPQDFNARVAPSHAEPVALALESIAWLSYATRESALDQAAQLLVRANVLHPDEPGIAEKLATIACELEPHHIRGFDDRPHKKEETVIGFVRAAATATERVLDSRFGVSMDVLTQADGSALSACLQALAPEELAYLQRSLERLAQLLVREGAFFENGVLLSLAIGSASSHLQSLGFPRGVKETVSLITDALQRDGLRLEDIGSSFDPLCNSLEAASAAYHLKWKLFRNHHADRVSKRCDALLDALGALRKSDA